MLPDGVTHTKGYVKDPEQARRYLSVTDVDGDSPAELGSKEGMDHFEITEKPEDRKRVDLTKNVPVYPISLDKVISFLFSLILFLFLFFDCVQEFELTNERFLVPDMLFRPLDLGLYHIPISVMVEYVFGFLYVKQILV